MRVLRTPDERFAGLPGFPYRPHYAEVGDGLRMAYLDEGAGRPVVLLHGEPTWSFLYRHVLPELPGHRVIVPDLIGFGRSDKPADVADHSYARQVAWTRALLLDHLGLTEITFVGQDWGGLIGLRLAAEHPERTHAIVAANTGLPTGDISMPDSWHRFRRTVATAENLDIARFVQAGCVTRLAPEIRAAYDAPFPDESYKAGPRALPGLVPIHPDNPAAPANRAAWRRLTRLDRPFLVAFSDRDPITGGMAPVLKRSMRGAAGIEHPVIAGAGHFLQEDAGALLGRRVAGFLAKTE